MIVARHDFNRSRLTAHNQIVKFGDVSLLRRNGLPDRACWATIFRDTSLERVGVLPNPLDRISLISVFVPYAPEGTLLDPEPNRTDILIALIIDPATKMPVQPFQEDTHFVMRAPVDHVATNNVTMFWRCQIRPVD